jgi:hypothetical protein
MTDDQHPIRAESASTSFLGKLFISLCVLVVAIVVVGYEAGWVTFQQDDQQERATIEVETGKVRRAAEEAVDKGRELLQRADDQIRNLKTEDATTDSLRTDGTEGTPGENPDGATSVRTDTPQG